MAEKLCDYLDPQIVDKTRTQMETELAPSKTLTPQPQQPLPPPHKPYPVSTMIARGHTIRKTTEVQTKVKEKPTAMLTNNPPRSGMTTSRFAPKLDTS